MLIIKKKILEIKMMLEALNFLKPREKDIIIKRRLTENPKTLEDCLMNIKLVEKE